MTGFRGQPVRQGPTSRS